VLVNSPLRLIGCLLQRWFIQMNAVTRADESKFIVALGETHSELPNSMWRNLDKRRYVDTKSRSGCSNQLRDQHQKMSH